MQLETMLYFGLVLTFSNADLSTENIAHVVGKVKDRFLSSSVAFFHRDSLDATWTHKLLKHLTSTYIMSSVWTPHVILSSTQRVLIVLPFSAAASSALKNPPITLPVMKDGSVSTLNGFFGHIWRTLETQMNFTTEYYVPQDGSWGARLANGSWSGTAGMMLSGMVEVAVIDFTLTLERASVLDYTQPLITTRFSVILRDMEGECVEPNWGNFLAPFSKGLWCTMAGTILLAVAVYRLFHTHFLEALFDIFSIFCQKGPAAMCLRRTSDRILNITLQLSAMVLNAAYSAALVSFLTAPSSRPTPPFETLEELLQTDYTLAVLANSGQLNFFDQQADNDSLLRDIYVHKILPGLPFPTTVEEGLQRLCERPMYAFMTTLDIALALNPPCTVLELPHASISDGLTMTMRKGSPYLPLINHNLQILKENGVLGNLREKTWPEQNPTSDPADLTWSSIGPETVVSSALIVCVGCILGVLILLREIYSTRRAMNSTQLLIRLDQAQPQNRLYQLHQLFV